MLVTSQANVNYFYIFHQTAMKMTNSITFLPRIFIQKHGKIAQGIGGI